MSEQRAHGGPAPKPVTPRHRRSLARTLGQWLAGTRRSTRGLLAAAAAVLVILVLGLGYVMWNSRDSSINVPPLAGGNGAAPSSPGPPSPTGADASASGPAEVGRPSRTPGRTAPTTPGRSPKPQPDPPKPDPGPSKPAQPRRVGPANLDGFTQLLSTYCQRHKFRTAVLLNGADEDPRSGDWVCVQVVDFTRINLDDACRESFGEQAQAREIDDGDARTWRCFDS